MVCENARRQSEPAQVGAILAGPPLARWYLAQVAVLLLISAGLLWVNTTAAYSALLGGLISVGPSYYFARQAFRFRGARFARHIARSFYVGATGKFALTACAFGAVFATVKPLNAALLLSAYAAAALGHWVVAARAGLHTAPARRL
jgi:ATP synthase protein I